MTELGRMTRETITADYRELDYRFLGVVNRPEDKKRGYISQDEMRTGIINPEFLEEARRRFSVPKEERFFCI